MNLISFSVFGDADKYLVGALRNAELAPRIYSDWKCRFYLSEKTDRHKLSLAPALEDLGAQVVIMDDNSPVPPTMWRYLAADDPAVTRVICRDTDSRLCQREAAACAEWINEDTIGWVMRDHPHHSLPIMGGMWGLYNKEPVQNHLWPKYWSKGPPMLWTIQTFLKDPQYPKGAYDDDQRMLSWLVWPWLQHSCTQHDSVSRDQYPGAKPFPTQRSFPRFVGEVYEVNPDGSETPRAGDWELIKGKP